MGKSSIITIDIEDLALRVREAPEQHVFFLGAGVSVTAGIPSANGMIRQLKEKIYRERNSLASNTLVREDQIDQWIARERLLDPQKSIYSQILAVAYPSAFERRRYIESLVDGRLPTSAHRLLAKLVLESLRVRRCVPIILTTNFDRLMEQALIQESGDFPYVAFHEQDVTGFPLDGNHPTVLKLHGDYLFEDIANLDNELAARYRGNMAKKLSRCLINHALIVIGYSGNDDTIMKQLEDLSTKEKMGRIYWLLRDVDKLNDRVSKLIASHPRRSSGTLRIRDADTFFDEFWRKVSGRIAPIESDRKTGKTHLGDSGLVELSLRHADLLPIACIPGSGLQSPQTNAEALGVSDLVTRAVQYPQNLHLLLGPSGSGKTTLLRQLYLELTTRLNIHPVVYDVGGKSPGWAHRAIDVAPTWKNPESPAKAILFDGLEHTDLGLEFVKNALTWKRLHSNVITIAAMSASSYIAITERVRTYWIAEIDPIRLEEYVRRMLGPRSYVILRLLSADGAFRRLCSRPLYLRMLLRLVQHYDIEASLTKGELFDRFCTGYLMDWQSPSGDENKKIRPLLDLLAYIASVEIEQGKPMSRSDLADSISQKSLDCTLDRSLLRTGLVFYRNDRIQFIHTTFRDYFGARYLYEQIKLPKAASLGLIDQPRWFNSFALLSSLVSDASSLIDTFLEKNTAYRTSLAIQALLESRQSSSTQLISILDRLVERFKEDVKASAHDLLLEIGSDSVSYIVKLAKSPLLSSEQKRLVVQKLNSIIDESDTHSRQQYLRALTRYLD
jgi:hypothetical protein